MLTKYVNDVGERGLPDHIADKYFKPSDEDASSIISRITSIHTAREILHDLCKTAPLNHADIFNNVRVVCAIFRFVGRKMCDDYDHASLFRGSRGSWVSFKLKIAFQSMPHPQHIQIIMAHLLRTYVDDSPPSPYSARNPDDDLKRILACFGSPLPYLKDRGVVTTWAKAQSLKSRISYSYTPDLFLHHYRVPSDIELPSTFIREFIAPFEVHGFKHIYPSGHRLKICTFLSYLLDFIAKKETGSL